MENDIARNLRVQLSFCERGNARDEEIRSRILAQLNEIENGTFEPNERDWRVEAEQRLRSVQL